MNFPRLAAASSDAVMCGLMNLLQWRLRREVCTRDELLAYLDRCAAQTREEFYALPLAGEFEVAGRRVRWPSPVKSGFVENDSACAEVFLLPERPEAPTVLILHALMSASANGYRKLAAWFNARGWQAAILHLPFHYSRVPRGYFNGSQAISANLIRNGETLRQGVVEVRQLMEWFRARGCRGFGLIGTSFGGWIAALTSFLERDFHFVSLIQPIVNVDHALWHNPSSRSMKALLRKQGIGPEDARRHEHLSSPLHGRPLCGGERVLICAGRYDTVSPSAELKKLADLWTGAELREVEQGHFGHAALRETVRVIESKMARGIFVAFPNKSA
ncbi:MAG TPA: hypothetical protein VIS74_08080 [Chthoniobacterales bacterium]